MIIWRHAAPVRIANNVPLDLLNSDADVAANSTPRRRRASTQAAPGSGHASARSSTYRARSGNDVVLPSIHPGRLAFQKRMAYGVWYLPKEQWAGRAYAVGSEQGASGGKGKVNANGIGERGRRGGEGGGDGYGSSSAGGGEDEEALADAIPKLYSSRIYKDFLKEKRYHRVPAYLSGVESQQYSTANTGPGSPGR